jgi:hypothetical protein
VGCVKEGSARWLEIRFQHYHEVSSAGNPALFCSNIKPAAGRWWLLVATYRLQRAG